MVRNREPSAHTLPFCELCEDKSVISEEVTEHHANFWAKIRPFSVGCVADDSRIVSHTTYDFLSSRMSNYRTAHLRGHPCADGSTRIYHHFSSPIRSPGHKLDCKNLKKGLHFAHKLQIPRLKARLCSLFYAVGQMKKSCGRVALLAAPTTQREFSHSGSSPKSYKHRGVAALSTPYCTGRNSSCPDAVADCIEFIKKSAALDHSRFRAQNSSCGPS